MISSCSVLNGKKTDKEKITREKKIEVSVIDSNSESVCVICLFPNDNETNRVFRKFPCCNQQWCHECLVELASFCNTLKKTDIIKISDQIKIFFRNEK